MKRLLLFVMLLIFATSNLYAKSPNLHAKSPSLQNSDTTWYFKSWKELLAQYNALLENYEASSPKAQEMEKKVFLSYKRMRDAYSSQYTRCTKMYKKHMDAGVKKGAPMVKELELEIENLRIIGNMMKSSLDIEQQKELLKWMIEKNLPETIRTASIDTNKPGERLVKEINGVEFAFRWCPAGSFMMGSPKKENGHYDREQLHKVTLSKGFWMLETPVTQKQWEAVMHTNPSIFQGDNLPVEMVSWYDCQDFCSECQKLGLSVALPSEAQWEYACRSGTAGTHAGNLNEMGWYNPNSNSQTHPVGAKKPNKFNLYDMHGNVWEWCYDAFEWDNKSMTNGEAFIGNKNSNRVSRGGSWKDAQNFCRSAFRLERSADTKENNQGFRIIIKQE